MKHIFVTFIAILLAMPMSAKQISQDAAKDVANRFIRQNSRLNSLSYGGDIALAYTASTGSVNNFYVYNLAKGGFVIVSADDCVEQVLGYSENGNFDIVTAPENMLSMLEGYKQEINYAIAHSVIGATAVPDAPEKSMPDRNAVLPLLTTKWNQNSPYNDRCPLYDDEQRCMVGCTATAMAQIMNYFEWPTTGTGAKSYNSRINGKSVTISVDFSTVAFDWGNMLDVYDSSATDAQCDAVATLMYCAGVGANMSYGLTMSRAYITDAYEAFVSYFDYDKTLKYTHRYYYSPSEWNDLVYNEVANGRPVLYAGYNSSIGHAFVCDGYSSDNFFHINWGWGGMSDGYFKLSVLNPDGQGIGGSDAGYNANQEILYGFAPNKGTAEYSYSVGYDGDFTCSATDVAASDVASTYINFSTGETIYQYFADNQSGITDLGVDVVNDITDQSTFISCDKFYCDLYENYYYKGFKTQASNFANLGDGSYTIYPAFSNAALGVSGRVLVPFGRQKAVKLTVNGGALSFSPVDIEQPVVTIHEIVSEANLYANKPYKINFKATCTGADFLDELYVVLYDADNEAVYSASNQFEILKGETVSDAIIGELSDVEASNYTLAICTLSNDEYRIMASTHVAVGGCSDDYNLTNNGFVFPSILNIYSREFETDCKVANTGGLFGGVFHAFIYSNTGVCVAELVSEYCLIDKDVTKTVHFSGSFDATPGKIYSIYLFLYDEEAGWIQIGGGTRFAVKGLSGIDEVVADAQGGVAVYPNPATDVVYVESPSAMGAIRVFSVGGQEVISADAAGVQRISLQVDNLPSGVYIMKVSTDDGVAVGRIVKQ